MKEETLRRIVREEIEQGIRLMIDLQVTRTAIHNGLFYRGGVMSSSLLKF